MSEAAEQLVEQIDVKAIADRISAELAERIGLASQRFLTVRQAANYVGVSEDSIRSMLLSRKITARRPVGGRILICRKELESAILASTNKPRRGRGSGRRNNGIADSSSW